jgi:uncharacterized protein YjbI with pentapeptide repeats
VSDNAAVIGALVALGGVFTAQMVSIALDDRRTQEARALEDRRTQEARDLEARCAGEAALQNYFEQVGELLIEKPLRRASPGDNLSTVVRAQTLSVLEGSDPDRKRILLLFLYESVLIYGDKPVVSLAAADLSEANLFRADLSWANLKGAYLRGAFLSSANVSEANLSEANLIGANLIGANLSQADLRGANLSIAILYRADLKMANLSGTDLSKADLREADLRVADLIGATNTTEQQLTECKSLEGATMPDGQTLKSVDNRDGPTLEDWLKSRGSGEDVKNE